MDEENTGFQPFNLNLGRFKPKYVVTVDPDTGRVELIPGWNPVLATLLWEEVKAGESGLSQEQVNEVTRFLPDHL